MSPTKGRLLAAVRAAGGYSLSTYINAVADRHATLGFGNMARRREKVARWEAGVEPERTAQLAMADLHGVDPKQVLARGWPDWLLLALPGPDVHAPFAPGVTLTALDDIAADPGGGDGAGMPLLPAPVLRSLAARWTEHIQQSIACGLSGGYIGGEVTSAVNARLTALWHLDDSLGGTACTVSARSDLRMVIRLLRHARHSGQMTRDLHYLAAEYARFLGWAEFDAGNTARAHRAWHAAFRASADAADPAHGAYLLANLALQAVYDQQPAAGVDFLTSARDLAKGKTPPLVLAMIDAWRVRAAAATGDARQAAILLNQADAEYERSQSGDENPAWAYWMCRPSHMAETGRAFLDLGDPAAAARLLSEGESALDAGATRDRVLYLVWIATAEARRRNLDAAADAATRALDVAAVVESGRCESLLADLSGELQAHRPSPAIGHVVDRLDAFVAAP